MGDNKNHPLFLLDKSTKILYNCVKKIKGGNEMEYTTKEISVASNKKAVIKTESKKSPTSIVTLTGNTGTNHLGEWVEFVDKKGNIRKVHRSDIIEIL